MRNQQPIYHLTRELKHAAGQRDWPGVLALDSQIADLLATLRSQTLSNQQVRALKQLQRLHQQVYHHCRQQQQQLKEKMAQYRHTGEGMQAYAGVALSEDES